MRIFGTVFAAIVLAGAAHAQDLQTGDAKAGKEKSQVCSACHGANGISLSDDIPNLAGQKSTYLVNQLNSFKSGKRKSKFMEPIAGSLDKNDIENLAAFFSELPHGGGHEKSDFGKSINSPRMELPKSYETDFTEYYRNSGEEGSPKKQTRIFRANKVALAALKAGRPLGDGAFIVLEAYAAKLDADGNAVKDENGIHVPDKLTGMIAQKIVKGAGADIPTTLRNEDWVYGSFDANGMHKDANLAKCYACHKAQDDSGYLFRLKELKAFATR